MQSADSFGADRWCRVTQQRQDQLRVIGATDLTDTRDGTRTEPRGGDHFVVDRADI